jgi:hypothetical protein
VERLLRVGALAAIVAAASATGVGVCPWAMIMRVPCPGCGMSRAASALAHGDVALASSLNPTAILTVPSSVALVAFFTLSYLYDGRLRANAPIPKAVALTTIAVLMAVWIARALGAFGGAVAV